MDERPTTAEERKEYGRFAAMPPARAGDAFLLRLIADIDRRDEALALAKRALELNDTMPTGTIPERAVREALAAITKLEKGETG